MQKTICADDSVCTHQCGELFDGHSLATKSHLAWNEKIKSEIEK